MSAQARTLDPVECFDLPEHPSTDTVYRLLPKNPDAAYYRERTDRNIGWITREEQNYLHQCTVGGGGCGGMGGLNAATLLRQGVGKIRIADGEDFDVSNANRQFAATRGTVGRSKAFETAKMMRAITDDTTLEVYPQGICEATVDDFLRGCDVVCDEIEFWAVGARILLHQRARTLGIPIFNCNTVGFGTRLFFFEPQGYTIEELLGFTYAEARTLQERIQSKTASPGDVRLVMERVLAGLVPELPEYSANLELYSTVEVARERLFEENRATIISTNPPMASGFLANHVLFYLLRNSAIPRNFAKPLPAPGYLYLDAGFGVAKRVERTEVLHE